MPKILIQGIVGIDTTPQNVRQVFDSANGNPVDIEINSPGGFVYDGFEIFNLVKNYPGITNITVVGLAASIASYIALAGTNIEVEENAGFMIHNVHGFVGGNAAELRKAAEVYDSLDNILINAYSRKTKKSKDEVRMLLNNTSWFFGDDIVKNGFANKTVKSSTEDSIEDVIAFSKLRFDECVNTIKSSGKQKEDFEKVAALLVKPNNSFIPPKNDKKEVTMNKLQDFLAQNPEAKAEYDKALADKEAEVQNKIKEPVKPAPENKTSADFQTMFNSVKNVITSAEYPKAFKDMAEEVISGKLDPAVFNALVGQYDANKEKVASAEAERISNSTESTINLGKKPGEQQVSNYNETGKIENEADYKAAVDLLKQYN